jgi:hypothetical protein
MYYWGSAQKYRLAFMGGRISHSISEFKGQRYLLPGAQFGISLGIMGEGQSGFEFSYFRQTSILHSGCPPTEERSPVSIHHFQVGGQLVHQVKQSSFHYSGGFGIGPGMITDQQTNRNTFALSFGCKIGAGVVLYKKLGLFTQAGLLQIIGKHDTICSSSGSMDLPSAASVLSQLYLACGLSFSFGGSTGAQSIK